MQANTSTLIRLREHHVACRWCADHYDRCMCAECSHERCDLCGPCADPLCDCTASCETCGEREALSLSSDGLAVWCPTCRSITATVVAGSRTAPNGVRIRHVIPFDAHEPMLRLIALALGPVERVFCDRVRLRQLRERAEVTL